MNEPYVVLHGGFHKTASTYLQRILQRNKNFMDKRGVYYVPHREMREQFTVPCQRNAHQHTGFPRKKFVDDETLREITRKFFDPIVERAPDRLILSDENLAGHCGNCIKFGRLYRFKDAFMMVSAREIPFPVREVHLSVRNYADFFAAAYVEYFRSIRADSSSPMLAYSMVDKVITRFPMWNGVIDRVKTYFPHAQIYIWAFEDFRKNPMMATQILSNISGPAIDVSKFRSPKEQNPRPTASQRAVDEIQNLMLSDGVQAAVDARRTIQEKYPRNAMNPGFDPWSEWERGHLTNLYAKDLLRLAKDPRVTMVRPDPVFAQ